MLWEGEMAMIISNGLCAFMQNPPPFFIQVKQRRSLRIWIIWKQKEKRKKRQQLQELVMNIRVSFIYNVQTSATSFEIIQLVKLIVK